MTPWVHEACKEWGRAMYRVLYGRDGWPSQSIIKQMMDYGLMGTNGGRFGCLSPEVLVGKDLIVNNAIKRLPEEPRTLVTICYVIRGPVKWKCARIGMDRSQFYDRIDRAHIVLASYIEHEEARFQQNSPNLSLQMTA